MVAPFDLEALREAERTTPQPTVLPAPFEPPEFHQLPESTESELSETEQPDGSTSPLSRRERRQASATGFPILRRARSERSPRAHPRRRWLIIVLVPVVVIAAAAIFVGVRLSAAIPSAVVTPSLSRFVHVDGPVNSLPWPPSGQAAIAVPSIGIDEASGPEQPAPVASLTKMMTAYVILQDHPLGPTQDGPTITMSQTDVDDFNKDTVEDQANAQVTVGEVLTERQLLGGMLVHSADNYADALARWDAGSLPAFVDKMNQTAASLGMHQTHYADASGFDPASQSTASDQLRVAGPDMNIPAFASLVDVTSITLPVAGTITSYTPLIGFDGVIGVKSGFTSQSGGCDVVAVIRRAHGLPVLVLAAVTGQQGPGVLRLAGTLGLTLSNAVAPLIGATPVIKSGTVVARVSAVGHTVTATVRGTANVLSWPGVTATRVFKRSGTIAQGAKAGTKIGSVIVTMGTQRVVLPVRLTGSLPKETLTQRVF
jgi:D-alanyl-D-alanine carboxypeptidase (penicillin-binding protein 5/6)